MCFNFPCVSVLEGRMSSVTYIKNVNLFFSSDFSCYAFDTRMSVSPPSSPSHLALHRHLFFIPSADRLSCYVVIVFTLSSPCIRIPSFALAIFIVVTFIRVYFFSRMLFIVSLI